MDRHVVVTGCEGFIGRALMRFGKIRLRRLGHRPGLRENDRRLRADLLDEKQTRQVFAAVPQMLAVVHTAALAHGQRPAHGRSFADINCTITANVLRAVQSVDPRLIFLSSVAVYGEDRRDGAVAVDAELRPATEYGLSKKLCEEMLLQSRLTHFDILRLTPAFDEHHMTDVRKRAFLPGLPIKLRVVPSPVHSLCHVNTVTQTVLSLLDRPPRARSVMNVADHTLYSQREIASWFPGRAVPLPVALVRPLYYATHLLPGKLGYRLRCTYWKLMKSNVYRT